MNSSGEIARARASAIWCAWMTAVPAGMILYGMVADSPFVAAIESDRLFLGCWIGIQIGALLTGAAIALGGAPLAWSALRDALSNHRRDILFRFAIPFVAAFAAFAWVVAVALWTGGHWAASPFAVAFSNPGWPSETVRGATGSVSAALLIFTFAASAVSVAQALDRSRFPEVRVSLPGAELRVAPLRFAGFLAPCAAAGFLVMFLSVIAWGYGASRNAAFHARLGPLGLSSSWSWLLSLILFAAAAVSSMHAARHCPALES
jgi:hypothetical protein